MTNEEKRAKDRAAYATNPEYYRNKARDTHVDHCHTTGIVRGILCSRCNLILGHAKDNTEILKSAIKYLCGDVIETIYLPDFNLN